MELGFAVDFTADGLNPNQRAIADNLDQIYANGVGTLGPALLGLLNVGSLDEYKNALDQLSPEIYSDAEIAALYSSLAFSNSLLSCKVNGTDTASIIREGQCLWAGASARFLECGTTSEQIGFDETAGLFTAGAQVALDDVWRLGVAGGFQSSTLQTATGAQRRLAGQRRCVKYNPGAARSTAPIRRDHPRRAVPVGGSERRLPRCGTTSDQIGFDETAGLFTAGAQVALDDVWRLGAAGGFQSSSLQTATGAQSEGSLAQGGMSLKYNPGPLLLAGAVTGGGGWYDTTRPMSFGGFTGVAEGDADLGIFNARLRAAYVFGDPHLYFKPILDANLTQLTSAASPKAAATARRLAVDGGGQTVFSLAPTLEVGTEWWLANGTLVRPLIRGRRHLVRRRRLRADGFVRRRAGRASRRFTINTDIDEVMGLVGAGVEVINGGDAVLRLSYDGQLGADDADPQRRHQGQRQVLALPSVVQRSGVRRVAGANVRAKRAGMFSSRWRPPFCAANQAASRPTSSAVAVARPVSTAALRALSIAATASL